MKNLVSIPFLIISLTFFSTLSVSLNAEEDEPKVDSVWGAFRYTGHHIKKGSITAGHSIKDGSIKAGKTMESGFKKAGRGIESGSKKAGKSMEKGFKKTGKALDKFFTGD